MSQSSDDCPSTLILVQMRTIVSPCPLALLSICASLQPVQVCVVLGLTECSSVCRCVQVCAGTVCSAGLGRDWPALCHHFIARLHQPAPIPQPASRSAQAILHSTPQ